MPEKLHPFSLRLPADLKVRLQKLAVTRRQPLSLMIVWVLEQWYGKEVKNFVPRAKPIKKVKPKDEVQSQ